MQRAEVSVADALEPPPEGAAPAAPLPASRPAGRDPRWRSAARSIGGILVALAIWELVSVSGAVKADALASVSATASALYTNAGQLLSALGGTLEAWAVGLGIATLLGVTLGAIVGRFWVAESFTEVLVRMMRPLPSLALIPVAILMAGLGLEMAAGLVAFTAFWPIFINTRYGVQQVDPLFIDSGRTLGLSRVGVMTKVIIPSASPLIASGLQISISLALVVTVAVELVAGSGGLGEFVLKVQQGNDIPGMYAGIIVGGLIGWVLNRGFARLVDWLLPWANRLASA